MFQNKQNYEKEMWRNNHCDFIFKTCTVWVHQVKLELGANSLTFICQKQHIFIYDQPTVRLPCLDQQIGPKLSDVTTVTSPTRWTFSVSDLTENLNQILPRVITKSTFNICPQKLFVF